jgi:gliding motility-associated-like protein/uncharacterized repeat protein (TIGR01451 family)
MKRNLLFCFLFLFTVQLYAADYYWVGGGGSWTDVNHWATTSGGSIKRSQVPSVNDDVYFDANSGLLDNSIIDLPNGNAYCRNMSWVGVTSTPLFRNSSSFTLYIAGNLELSPTVRYAMQRIEFTGSGNATYKMNGAARVNTAGWYNPFAVNKPGGSLTLLDGVPAGLVVTTIRVLNGHLNMSNHKHTFESLDGNNANNRSLDITNSEIWLSKTWDYRGANSSLTSNGSYINTLQFHSDGHHFPKVDINRVNSNDMVINNTSFGELTFTSTEGAPGILRIGGGNTIDRLEFKSNGLLREGGNTIGELIVAPGFGLQVFLTNTITKLLKVNTPDCSGLPSLVGSSNGTLNFATGAVADLRNVYIQNLKATGDIALPIDVVGADGEGNSGWNFQVPATGTTLYWVGGAGDWNDKNHWSATSGGAGGYCVPFSADDVIFDENSGFTSTSNIVTTSGNTWCHNMVWQNVQNAPVLNKHVSYNMEVHGSLVMNSTVTMNTILQFKGDQPATVTTNGNGLGDFRIYIQKTGTDGGITFLDDIDNPSAYIALHSGKCILSERTVNIGTFTSGSGTRTIDITNANITVDSWAITGGGRTWVGGAAGSFITANSSFHASGLIYPKVHIAAVNSVNINSVTFGELVFTNPSPTSLVSAGPNNTIETLEFKGAGFIGGNNTINNLLLAPSKQYFFEGANTINGLFHINNPAIHGLGEIRGRNGNSATLNFGPSASLNISNVYVKDMTATGNGVPIPVTGADAGGNIGFDITASAGGNRYWVGGSGDWNDAGNWSESSGGPGGACVPTVDTDVYFDASSFVSGGSEVTISNGNAYCRNMDWTGATNNPIFTKHPLFDMEIWGNLVMNPLVTMTSNNLLVFAGATNATVTTNGSKLGAFHFRIKKSSENSTVKIMDDMINPLARIEIEKGGLDLKDRIVAIEAISDVQSVFPTHIDISNAKLDVQWFYTGSHTGKSLLADGSEITSNYFVSHSGKYDKVNVITVAQNRITISNSTFSELIFTNPSSTSQAHISGGNTIDRLEFKGRGNINGTGNTIGTLIFAPGKVYTLLAGSNNTITGHWFGSGTPCNLTEIVSSSATANATITKASGGVDFDYIRLRRITAVSPTPFVAHEHSVDQGNNINWDVAPYDGASPILGLGPDLVLNLSQFPYTLNTDGFFGSPLSQYEWKKDGVVVGSGNELSISEVGTYSVKVDFPDGCSVSDEIVVSRAMVDLLIEKTVDNGTPDVGSNVVFKLVVTNEGPGEGTDISVEDLLPAGYAYVSSNAEAGTDYDPATGIWTVGTLAIGESSALTITSTVNATGSYENTATVTASEVDPVPENNSSTVTPVPVPVADLSVVKTVDNLNPYAGNNVVFNIEVSNEGPSDATGVSVKDLLPSGYAFVSAGPSVGNYDSGTGVWTIGNLANGGNATLTITATVNTTGVYENIAEVSGDQADRVSANNLSTITPTPIIVQIDKVGPSTANTGTEITYVLSVTNTGTGEAIGQIIEDIVPAELTGVEWKATALGSATISSGTTGTGNDIGVIADIPAGGGNQITVTVTGRVPASSSATSLSNTATVSATGSPGFSSNTVVTALTKQADLRIQKTGPSTVVAGSEVTYTLEVTNAGPSDAKNVTITDMMPVGLNGVTWTATAQNGAAVDNTSGADDVTILADIPAGTGSVLVTIKGTLDAGYADASLMNTATATPETGVVDPTPATARVTSTVSRVANIRITKSGPANIGAGEDIRYTLRVVNDGPSKATDVEIKDVLPMEIQGVSWASTVLGGASINGSDNGNGDIDLTGNLPSGGVIEIEIKGRMDPGATDGSSFTNTATANLPAGSSITDPDLTSNTSTVTTLVSNTPNFTVSKSGPSTVNIGDPIQYTIVVRNSGLGNITGAQIKDEVPSSVIVTNWNIVGAGGANVTGTASGTGNSINRTGDIPVGGLLTVNISGIVGKTTGLQIVNTVTVTAGDVISSDVISTVNQSTDVIVEKSGPQSAAAGLPITYTVKVSNAGPIDAEDLTIKDNVPIEVESISWSATVVGSASIRGTSSGDTNAIEVNANIDAGAGNYILITVKGIVNAGTNAATITNTASVALPSGTLTDFNPINNASTVETIIVKETDLSITKVVDYTSPMVGSNVVFTLVAMNKGPSVATGVKVTDLLPAGYKFVSSVPAADYDEATGKWTIGTLANGASETLTITAIVNASGPYENVATIIGLEADPDLANNTTSAITTPIPQAHLITVKELKDGMQSHFVPGDVVLYTIRVENQGPSAAENVNIKDIAPLGTQISAWRAIPSAGVIYPNASGTGNLNETLSVLANGDAAVYEVEVKTPSNFASALVNTVSVSSTTKDSNPGACVACTTPPLPSVGKADIVTVKTLKDPAQTTFVPGEEVVYNISVTNNGPSDAQVVNIKDSAPTGTTINGWTATVTSGTVTLPNTSGTGNLDETITVLPNGAVVGYEVRVKTSSGFIGDLVNLASATSVTDDPDPTCADCETAPITAAPIADLVTVKTTTDVTQTSFVPGETVVYGIRVTNNGPSDARNVNIKDVAPTGTVISGWTAKVISGTVLLPNLSGAGNLDETIATLPNGAMVSYEVMVQTPANFAGALSNTAAVTSSTDDPNPICTTCTTTPLTAVANADLVTVKTTKDLTQTTFVPGEEVVYTITVTNDGPSDAQDVNIKDSAPIGTTISGWTATVTSGTVTLPNTSGTGDLDETIVTLPNGTAVSYEVTVETAASFNSDLVNLVSVSSSTDDPDPSCPDCETTPLSATPIADLVTVKTTKDLAQTTFVPGEEVVYTITVTNNGPSDAQQVNIKDAAPTGTTISGWTATVVSGTVALPNTNGTGDLDQTIATLPNGAAVSYEVRVKTPAGFTGNLSNKVMVTSGTYDPDPVCTACETVPLTPVVIPEDDSRLELWKTGTYHDLNSNGTVDVGDVVNYGFTVRNTGNTPIDGIRLDDPMVPVSGGPISLAAGESDSGTFTAVYAITQADLDQGQVVNQATATGTDPNGDLIPEVPSDDPNTPQPNDPTVVYLVGKPSITLKKGVTSEGPYDVGDHIKYYNMVVTNTGNVTLTNVVVVDDNAEIIAGSPISRLLPGESATVMARHVVTQADVDAGQVINQARVSGNDPGGNRTPEFLSDDPDTPEPGDKTITQIAQAPSIRIDKTADRQLVEIEGDRITYQLQVVNTGNVTLHDVVVKDPLTGFMQQIAQLKPGAANAHTFKTRIVATASDFAAGKIINTATVTAKGPDGREVNHSATVEVLTPLSKIEAIDDVASGINGHEGKTGVVNVLDNDLLNGVPVVPSEVILTLIRKDPELRLNPDGSVDVLPGTTGGTYILEYQICELSNPNNCSVARVAVHIENPLKIPNVFTPNGDGRNDTFVILGLEGYDNAELTIFNRWGNEVYRNRNYKNNWDGSNLNEGTYYYLIVLKKDGKESVHKGWVLLKR